MGREVVVTGFGVVTAFGPGLEPLWDGLKAGETAIGPIEQFDPEGFDSTTGGEVKGFSAKSFVPKHYRKATKVMARDTELAVAAAQLAVDAAGIVTRAQGPDAELTVEPGRMGCHIGAGLIAAEVPELAFAGSNAVDGDGTLDLKAWGEAGMANLPPLWMLKYLPNMLACHVTILHGAEGPSNTITCGEASALLSLGESQRVIERGDADLCFSGGAESRLNPVATYRVQATGRLAKGDAPSAPFDPKSPGLRIGEAGGIVILESSETAKARGAAPIAVVSGYAAAQSMPGLPGYELGDAGTWGSPPETNEGLASACRRAIADAGLAPADIDAVVPHGAGYAPEDDADARALETVFGDRLATLPIVLWADATGDSFAGNGAVQAAIAAECVRRGELPRAALIGGGEASPPDRVRNVLVCTGSVGGQNAAVVLSDPRS
ncbi:MAG: beta-ketoacyl synthase N-terminal-like domain-containing protein [Planctomycetota bacterium]